MWTCCGIHSWSNHFVIDSANLVPSSSWSWRLSKDTVSIALNCKVPNRPWRVVSAVSGFEVNADADEMHRKIEPVIESFIFEVLGNNVVNSIDSVFLLMKWWRVGSKKTKQQRKEKTGDECNVIVVSFSNTHKTDFFFCRTLLGDGCLGQVGLGTWWILASCSARTCWRQWVWICGKVQGLSVRECASIFCLKQQLKFDHAWWLSTKSSVLKQPTQPKLALSFFKPAHMVCK